MLLEPTFVAGSTGTSLWEALPGGQASAERRWAGMSSRAALVATGTWGPHFPAPNLRLYL